MTSLGQILANQENAQKSTGPTSEEGKFKAALNRVVHGFRGVNPVVSGESEFQFATFKKQLLSELEPHSIEQAELVEEIAGLMWKRRRLDRMETALFEQSANMEEGMTAVLTKFRAEMDLLLRYKKEMRRDLSQARAEFRRLKAEQEAMEKTIDQAIDEKLQLGLERARMKTEDATVAQKLTAEQSRAFLMREQGVANGQAAEDLHGWLKEKEGLHRMVWGLVGLGEVTQEAEEAEEAGGNMEHGT